MSGFNIVPQNFDQAQQLAAMISNSQIVPKSYQGKQDDCFVAMMLGAEIGLNPIQALQNIAVINGKPSIYGDAMLALTQKHPAYGGHLEAFDDATNTASCTVWRKGGDKYTVRFSQADAEKAGLWGKVGPWKSYPKRMLQMRARGFALRDQFADALAGLICAEEAEDLQVIEKDVTPTNELAKEVAELPLYPSDRFESSIESWKKAVNGGKKPSEIIEAIETRFSLSEQQKNKIEKLEPVESIEQTS